MQRPEAGAASVGACKGTWVLYLVLEEQEAPHAAETGPRRPTMGGGGEAIGQGGGAGQGVCGPCLGAFQVCLPLLVFPFIYCDKYT